MTASNYLEEALANHIFRDQAYTKPSTLAVALCTSGPTETATGATITEVASGTGYARVAVGPSTATWSLPSAGTQGQVDNLAALVWTASGGNWGTITSFAICDSTAVSSSTGAGGNVICYGDFSTARIVNDGDTLTVAIGDLDVGFS